MELHIQEQHALLCTGGVGNWTTEGCVISGGGPNSAGTVTCSCNHLTNFAVRVVSDCDMMCQLVQISNHTTTDLLNTLHTCYNSILQSTEPVVCEQIQDGFVCGCNAGFELAEDRATCTGNACFD